MELFPLRLVPLLPEEDETLYVRSAGEVTPCDGGLFLPAGAAVTLDTCYNAFSYGKYRDYTVADDCALRLRLRGDCLVTLLQLCEDGTTRELSHLSHSGDGDAVLTWQNSALSGYGLLFAAISAETDCTLLGGRYETDAVPTRDIFLGVCICTYKREDYVTATIARLSTYAADCPVPARLRVYVADNGNTLDAAALSDAAVTVMPNRNLGGSGGFARCLLECDPAATHVLLMDDDIVFDTAAVTKTLSFLLLTQPAHFALCLGGGMMLRECPHMQYEAGAKLTPGACGFPDLTALHGGLDLRRPEQLLKNEAPTAPDYLAWWYCCMPRTDDLPFPFFFKYDDVEYGLRRGAECLVPLGVSVAHESFAAKATDAVSYYDIRNRWITLAIRGEAPKRGNLLRFLWYWLPRRIGVQRYESAALYLDAMRDYLRGAPFLAAADAEAIHTRVRPKAPVLLPPEQLTDIPQSVKRVRMFWEARGECKGHKRLLHQNAETGCGYVSTRSAAKALLLGVRLLVVSADILLRAGSAARSFSRGAAALCTRAAWEQRLGLNKSTR